jgi:hypothetical protein
MGKILGGADPASVAAVAIVRRRSAATLRRGKPARVKRATVAAPVAAPAPAPERVTVSGKGRPRALPAAVVGTCGLTALPGRYDGRAAREAAAVRAAGPVVHDVPAAVPGDALRVVGGVLCAVNRATGEVVESDVQFAGPVYRPALAGKGRK